jgi:ATP-binding cassette subfamily F protein uup
VLLVSHDRDFLDRVATSVIAWDGPGKWLEYAGGYSDMTRQRGAAPAAQLSPTPVHKGKRPAAPVRLAAKGRTKLTYKDKYALENLPKQIDALNGEIAAHNKVLAENGLFGRDPSAFEAVASALKEAEAALEAAENQWLTLEEAREESERA